MNAQINIYPTPTCVVQERAYTAGWLDRASGLIRHQPPTLSKFYARGWNDREIRDRCAAMYAAERKTNGRA